MDHNIKQRIIIFISYLITSYLMVSFITGNWDINNGSNSVWFVSVVAYLIYYIFVAYYFVKPQDSLATSITTFFILTSLDITNSSYNALLIRNIGIIISVCIVLISMLNIAIHKSSKWSQLNKITYRFCQYFGSGEILFFPILLYCSLTFYNNELNKINIDAVIWLNFYYFFIITSKPIEFLIFIFSKFYKEQIKSYGEIIRIDSPNIVRIDLKNNCEWGNDNYFSKLSNSKWIRIIPIGMQIQSNSYLGTGIYCEYSIPNDIFNIKNVKLGEIYKTTDRKIVEEITFEGNMVDIEYIGFIIENSSISNVNIEITTDVVIEEGYIIIIKQRDLRIYYQVIDGVTSEEIFMNNPKGKMIIRAFQLGSYSDSKGFSRYSWVPYMNTPVFLVKKSNDINKELHPNEIGFIPNSNIKILVDPDDLVKYHCAILGVTGTGKTELALDIVKNNVSKGIKVFCVDFTGDYQKRLSEYNPIMLSLEDSKGNELKNLIEMVETGEFGAGKEKAKFKQYVEELNTHIEEQVKAYIESTNNLAIIELPEISNTRASLRITEIYLSSLFKWAKNNRNSKIIQIVLEEAHTIIPENNYFKYDKVDTDSVIGRISQIALQGRKYGVGLMIISQRTALVSKTILSQCNTFFTFNLIDKTSLDFLGNVYSNEHIDTIKNLKKYQLLVYGKAINTDNPVIVEIPYSPEKEKASKNISSSKLVNNEEEVEEEVVEVNNIS